MARDSYRSKGHGTAHGIPLKKRYGQHFLRDQSVVDDMLAEVTLNTSTPVFEIGPGDGFLTQSILKTEVPALWAFEIDPEWSAYIKEKFHDPRLTVFQENFLDIDFKRFDPLSPWTLLANLPYQVTFPILKRLQEHRILLRECVIMVQEEVAQKIVAQAGDSTMQSLYYSYYFTWKLLRKVSPGAFYPPPQVYSRLLYCKPRLDLQLIPDENKFWCFVKMCFLHRRRTLKNNISSSHYPLKALPEKWARARAQELSLADFLELWEMLRIQ